MKMPIINLEDRRPYKPLSDEWVENELIGAYTRLQGTKSWIKTLEYEKDCREKERDSK